MKRQVLLLQADQGTQGFLKRQAVPRSRPGLGTYVGLTDHVPLQLRPAIALNSDVAMHRRVVPYEEEMMLGVVMK